MRCRGVGPSRAAAASITAHVYVPACLIVAFAAALIGFGWATGWGGESYGGSVQLLRVVVLGPVSLTFISLIMVVERVRPRSAGRSSRAATARTSATPSST